MEGSGREWLETVSALQKSLGGTFPVEAALGPDVKSIQNAVDRLRGQHVEKIVVVPLILSSYSGEADQIRYLLGIRKDPPANFLPESSPHQPGTVLRRVRSSVPLVLTRALDDHPLMIAILTSRAQAQGKEPAKEALLFVGGANLSDKSDSQWIESLNALAERVRRRGGFHSAAVFMATKDASADERDQTYSELRARARALKRQGPVIVVPLALSQDDIAAQIPKTLAGIFVKFNGQALLPDPRVTQWVEESVLGGARLPDMRTFRDEGRPIPKTAPRRAAPVVRPGGRL